MSLWNKIDILRKDNGFRKKISTIIEDGSKQIDNKTVKYYHYKVNIYIISDSSVRFEENNLHILNCMQDIFAE